jgi:hypothetical protein
MNKDIRNNRIYFRCGWCGLHVLYTVLSGISASSSFFVAMPSVTVDAKKIKFVWGYPSNTVQCRGRPSKDGNRRVLTVPSTVPST